MRPTVNLGKRSFRNSLSGAQLVEPALDERKAVAWLEWDYAGPSDDGLPFEWKPSDWGYLDGRVVAVDYAATAEF